MSLTAYNDPQKVKTGHDCSAGCGEGRLTQLMDLTGSSGVLLWSHSDQDS